jgi:subtilisin family serine protease
LILDTDDHSGVVAEVERYGGKVFSAYKDRVSVGVPVDMVRQQLTTEDPGAIFEDMTGFEHVIAVRLPEPMIPDGSEIEGEGVDVIDAGPWHDAGITGAGVKVAILDMGFDNYESLLGKELPDSVTYEKFGTRLEKGEIVHGTACAEIVHELAPDAELYLVEFGDDISWYQALDYLVEQDVDIVSHSVGSLVGPRDGSAEDARRIDELVTTHNILWVNSSGNEALSHYRSVFTDEDGDGFHEFPSGEYTMAIASYTGEFVGVLLQWDDDWERPTQDYQLHLYNKDGELLGSSLEEQSGEFGQEPFEVLAGDPEGEVVYAVVEAENIDEPVAFDIFVVDGEVGWPTPEGSLGIPSDARYSLTVGAANWEDDSLAEYSSQGPTTDGRLKPEISAPTGVSGASYGKGQFDGTSSSCPHVAGAAALVWQANPGFSRQETADFLIAAAKDLGPAGPDTGFGYGRLQLPGDPSASPGTPTDTPDPSEPTRTPGPTPEPTQAEYTRPTRVPPSTQPGPGTGLLTLAGVGVVVIGLGCGGVLFLVIGVIGLVIIGRRGGRARPGQQPARPVPPPPPPSASRLEAEICSRCGATIRPGARFCSACGQSREPVAQQRQCPHCGAALRAGGRFCPKCGQPLQ